MSAWGFVVVYLAAFVLLQLAIYRYLRGHREDESGVAFTGQANADRGPGGDADAPEPGRGAEPVAATETREGPIRRCPTCGATNDPDASYTFCRSCASRLPR